MDRKWRYALIGSLVTAGLIGGFAAGSHRFGPRFAFAESPRHHGFGHWHDGDGFDHLCGEHREATLDTAIAYLKRTIRPTEAQSEPFARFARSLNEASGSIARVCADTAPAAPSAADALARMEAVTAAALEALRTVRPAFDALYATLDQRQRAALDDMFVHERHT